MNNRYYDIDTNNGFLYGKVSKIVKGVSHMKNKKIKIQSAKVLANASLQLGKVSANSSCIYIFHQPKMPDELKKLKKR